VKEIRACRTLADVDAAERSMPSPGLSRWHHGRYDQVLRGESTYLLAWVDGLPVAHLNVVHVCKEDPVRRRFGIIPEMNALGTRVDHRGEGLATALLDEGARLMRKAGHRRVCLMVGLENPGAARLYEQLGYRDDPLIEPFWVDWTFVRDDGTTGVEGEMVRLLTLSLED
jgi:ribosomal protein S18 acetylase RimI-like enzyme